MKRRKGPVIWGSARHPDGEVMEHIGLDANGELINPRGYDPKRAREAIAAAQAYVDAKHAQQRELRADKIARKIIECGTLGPRQKCIACNRKLRDAESIERGVGSDCWIGVLACLERIRQGES